MKRENSASAPQWQKTARNSSMKALEKPSFNYITFSITVIMVVCDLFGLKKSAPFPSSKKE
jgi:hypothetical protein